MSASKKMTPAAAAKLRKAALKKCGCLRCAWALSPCLTFAEHDARTAATVVFNTSKTWPVCRAGAV